MPDGQIFGSKRYVLYLEAATQTLSDIDGSRQKGIRQAVEKFLSSPASAFDKQVSGCRYVWQIRHLSTNTRAFATWCQNKPANAELCVVLDMYDKKNEVEYFDDIDAYNKEGGRFDSNFSELDTEEINHWVESLKNESDIIFIN